ncbi:hypothetical protein [Lacrimispora indolis]|uniref:hypothetical protein n=1 Tax=Lacrimispora indolis TaxID=69825 RepID=UPI00040E970E|nr:hypothetical protein [[Clostridium] methoxybenzovorans]
MRGTTKIKDIGTVNLEGVCIENGQIEVHVPVKAVRGQLDKVLDGCLEDFSKHYPDVEESEINIDVNVVLSFGAFRESNIDKAEFTLLVYVWQDSNDDNVKTYDEIPLTLNDEDSKKIKKIIWDGLGEALFNL